MLKLILLAVLVYQANCFIQSYDYNDAIKKTEDMVISPLVPEGYGHFFQRTARLNTLPLLPRLRYKQVVENQEQPLVPPVLPLPNLDEMVIKSLVTDVFGDRDAEILFNNKIETPKHESTQKVSKPSSSWMIEIAEEENADMQVQDDKKLKQILEILGLESTDELAAKPVFRPTWKNQNGIEEPKPAQFFSQEFNQYLQEKAPVAPVAPLAPAPVAPLAPAQPEWNLLNQQQQSNWQMNQPSEVKPSQPESSWEQLKEKVVESEKTFVDQLIKPQVAEKPLEKHVEVKEKPQVESESDDSEWNVDNQEDEEEDGAEKLVAKQEEVMNAFAAAQTSEIDSSYVFIELGQKLEHQKAAELIRYISDFTQVPYESFKDWRINGNLMVFKIADSKVSAWSVSNSILTHKLKIWHALGETVLSSGVGKELKSSDSKNTVMIIAIVLSISFSLCLAALIICCMIRRKSQSLRDQLMAAGDVGLMKAANLKKRGRDDEESLIRDNTSSGSNWISYLPFIKRAQKDQARGEQQLSSQQDYQRMQSNMISTSIQNEVGTKVSVTPVRVNSQDEE